MELNENTTIQELYDEPNLYAMRGNYISSVNDQWMQTALHCSLREIHEQHPTWGLKDMLYGLYRLEQAAYAADPVVFSVYPEKEIAETPEKAQVQLVYFSALEKQKSSYALLLSGGAYGAVCTLSEAMPVAARLNEFGYSCFCLNYRTASKESFIHGLLPKPLEDIATALRLIRNKAKSLGINPDRYLMGGFSAGGHLAALWGTAHLGARAYELPQPELLMLGYPLVNSLHFPKNPLSDYLKEGMYGTEYTTENEMSYAVNLHIDEDYPPVYLAAARDDDTIPENDTTCFASALEKGRVTHHFEIAAHGGHGFGLGSETELFGWVDRAMKWMEMHYGA